MKTVYILLTIIVIIILEIAVFLKLKSIWYPAPTGQKYGELYTIINKNVSIHLFLMNK